jgi:putative transposase
MSELPGYNPEVREPCPPKLTIQQLQAVFDQWVIDEYMHKVHSEINETPFDRWSKHHQHPRLASSLESLDILLMTVPDERTVQQDGIRIFKLLYYATEFCGLVGKQVTARYDPRNISEVLVYLDNTLVCRAKCAEIADQKPSLKEHMKARNAYKRDLRKDIKSFVSFADSFPESQRKIPEQAVAVATPISKSCNKLRRYRVDE